MIRFHFLLLAVVGLIPAMLGQAAVPASHDALTQRSERLFRDADGFWSQEFASLGGLYVTPKLSLYTQKVNDPCNVQDVLVGPFYCPINQHVFLDLTFLKQVVERTGRDDKLALRYVIGHEIGQHVQNVLGTTELVEQARSRSTPQLSARTWATAQLQADCYAGLWLHSVAKGDASWSPAEVSDSLQAVAAISQQRQAHLSSGQLMADPFTEGTPAQRLKWFQRGLDSGRFSDCDTFHAEAAGKL